MITRTIQEAEETEEGTMVRFGVQSTKEEWIFLVLSPAAARDVAEVLQAAATDAEAEA